MVLQRRANRLKRQEEAAAMSTPPPAAAASAPLAAPPSQQQEQQQPQQQQRPGAYPPPRYAPINGNGPSSYAPPAPAPPAVGMNGAGAQLATTPQPDSRGLQGRPREEAATPRKTTTVRFWLKFKAEWGQRLKVVGTHEELGEQSCRAGRGRHAGRRSMRAGLHFVSDPTTLLRLVLCRLRVFSTGAASQACSRPGPWELTASRACPCSAYRRLGAVESTGA